MRKAFIILVAFLSISCNKPESGYILPSPSPKETPEKEDEPDSPKPTVTSQIYSVSSAPGQDASSSICISWASDLTCPDTYVLYTAETDSKWKNAKKVNPEQNYKCEVFNGVASVDAGGNDNVETAVFNKYGASLYGLAPDTEYKYVIQTVNGTQTKEKKFKTAGAKEWSCCLISDFHSYTPLPKRLTNSMGIIDKMQTLDPSLDWVLSAGDVVAWGGSYSFWKRLFEEDNFAEFMWARANGNHDNWTKESQVTGDYDIPNDYFKGTSYFPQNGYSGEEGVCYYFRYGNTLFVVLNTEDMDSGAEFTAASNWAKTVINNEKKGTNPPTFTVVCMHYEWFYGTNGKTQQYSRWHSIFDQLGVDLAYAGNNHVYLRSYPIYNGKVTSDGKGTVYLQTPASDNDRGRDIAANDFQNKELIAYRWTEGSHSVGAVHMEVNESKMVLTLIDRNGKTIDTTEIKAKK